MPDMKLFAGNAVPELAQKVADRRYTKLGNAKVGRFSDGEISVEIHENVRGSDVFIIQSTCAPTNDNLMELLIMIDACKRASAGRITAVVPYYGYGRTDKKDQPRVPITARLVADLLTAAGADRLLTVDLHAGQIQGFFNIPVDELTTLPLLGDYFAAKEIQDLVVVAVDIGISKKARDIAERLGAPLAIIEKRRMNNNDISETMNVIGEVEGKTALVFDDEIVTGGSIVNAAKALYEQGVKDVFCCVTHPVLSKDGSEVMAKSKFSEVVVTDTIPMPAEKRNGKFTVISVAPLLGEAIYRIHKGQSVGDLFK